MTDITGGKPTNFRYLTIGWPGVITLVFGKVQNESGSLQGYIQLVVWKISTQISCKWLP